VCFRNSRLRIAGDPSAPGRAASFVVSGVGFLGAGLIFKDGANVHGRNTTATVWCSAAIGVLAGIDSLHLASLLAVMVILTNIALRALLGMLRVGVVRAYIFGLFLEASSAHRQSFV
jgi:putative Mg2+ transporter-C (MgtC) family protein